jgi:hypothetical protein
MIPHDVSELGVKVVNDPSEAVLNKDVIMALRFSLRDRVKHSSRA